MIKQVFSPHLSTTDLLIGYAIKAPSSHNSQPWRFVSDGPSRIRVYTDVSRGLPIADPAGRELLISCGAAIENLVVAARAFGFDCDVTPLPDAGQSECVAVLNLSPGEWPTDEESLLFDAIECRQTVRGPFAPDPVDAAILPALASAAASRGAMFVSIDAATSRARLSALVQDGDRRQFADRLWRRELAFWLRGPRGAEDGMPLGPVTSLARVAVRAIDLGGRVARTDAALVEQAPALGILATAGDSRRDWLGAGRSLERLLLTAARHGLQAGFLNQPCQIPELREQLRTLLLGVGYPQIVLRLGKIVHAAWQTPRRPVSEVRDIEARGAPLSH